MTDTVTPIAGSRPEKDSEGHMPLVEHIRELRNRIAVCLVGVVAGGAVGWWLYPKIFDFLVAPYNQAARESGRTGLVEINYQAITSGFNIHIKVALFVGLVIAAPVWLYEIWAFVVPGLKKTEKRYALGFLGAAIPLFLLGGYLATRVIPVAVGFLIQLTPKNASAIQDVDNVISFATKMILGFGIMFVLPVLLVGLNFLGILPARTMAKGWRVAVLLIFVLSAIASPSPDPGSMLLLALPVVVLFLLAMGIAFLNDKRRARRSTEPDYSQFADDEASPIEPPSGDR